MRLFTSDNVSPACSQVMDALAQANRSDAWSYGNDHLSKRLNDAMGEVFETEVSVFPVLTGTASNGMALASIVPPFGKVYCHRYAHIYTDECGAPEFFSGGAKLIPLNGVGGKIDAREFASAIHGQDVVHHAQPAAVSITQACENGRVYSLEEITGIGEVAHASGLKVHMDGARFANALVSLGITPAEMTWKAGVDVLSFGATKNGCLAAEAVVFFNRGSENVRYMQKRSGQLLSKTRFIAAQLLAYISDDLWLRNARNANAMATLLSEHLAGVNGIDVPFSTQSNVVFASLSSRLIEGLRSEGIDIGEGELEGTAPPRFVTAWNTTAQDVESFVARISEISKARTAHGGAQSDT